MSAERPVPAKERRGDATSVDAAWVDAAWVALGVFVVHAAIALWLPLPGSFGKYSVGGELVLDGSLPAERAMDFSPLYLQLHATMTAVAPEHAATIVEWLQIAWVALAFGGFHLLLAPRFGRRLALGALAVLSIDRHVLVYERILEPEPLLLALTVALLVALQRAGASSRPWPWLLGAGVTASLALATRPTLLPLVVLVPIALWLEERARATRSWQSMLRGTALRAAAFALPVALTLGLLALRAHALTGDARSPLMNPGTVFFEGNNATSHGTSAIYPPIVVHSVRHEGGDRSSPDVAHVIYRRVARADLDSVDDPESSELSLREVNAYWSGRAVEQLRAHPARALSLGLEKLGRAVHGFRWHDVPTAWRYEARLPIPSVPFALISALFLVGLLVEARRWRGAFLFYALAASQMAVMVVFYVSARQRLTLFPAIAYFALAAVDALIRPSDDGARVSILRRRPVVGLLVVLLMVVAVLPDDAMIDEIYRRERHLLVDGRLQAVRDAAASSRLADHQEQAIEALATAPWWLDWMRPAFFPQDERSIEDRLADRLLDDLPSIGSLTADPARFDAAEMLLEAGRLDEAEPILRDLVERGVAVYRGGRQTSQPAVLLARLLAARGRADPARETLRGVLRAVPDEPFALADLAALGGDTPEGDSPVERLESGWSRLDAHWLLGEAFLRHGDDAAAASSFAWLLERLPRVQEAHLGLAVALSRRAAASSATGDPILDDRAIAHLMAANAIRVEPIHHADEIAALVTRWVARPERTPPERFLAARILHQVGRFEKAREILDAGPWPQALRPRVEEIRRLARPPEKPPAEKPPVEKPPGTHASS